MKKTFNEKDEGLSLLALTREEMATIQGGDSLFYIIGHWYGKLLLEGAKMQNELGLTAYDVAL